MRGHSPARHIPTAGKVLHWAPFYNAAAFLMTFGQEKRIRRETVELAGIAPGQAVLDVGCGTGSLTLAAKRAAGDGAVSGIDPSENMIEVARRDAARARQEIDFRVAVIEDLPFPDAAFDVVLSSLMLHHLPDGLKPRGLAEALRVLKPGGRFFAVDMPPGTHGPVGHIAALLGRRKADLTSLEPLLADAGFQEIATGPMTFRVLAYATARKPPA